MSARHERIADTVILLGATGITGTPAEMTNLAEQLLDQPDQFADLNARIQHSYGAEAA